MTPQGFDFAVPFTGSIEGLPQLAGFGSVQRQRSTAHNRRVAEAARLYADCLMGREDPRMIKEAMIPRHEAFVTYLSERYPGLYGDPGGRMLGLREAMAVTDYQALYVDVLDRMYYGYWTAQEIVTLPLFRRHTLRDFRAVKRYMLDGMTSPWGEVSPGAPNPQASLLGPVPQDGSTLGTSTSTAAVTYDPKAYGCGTSINWAAFLGDDLGIFNDVARRLMIQGNNGISKFLSQQFFDANGPHASLFTTAYHNIINTTNGASVNNPPLGSQGLMDATKVLAAQLDSAGNPIIMNGKAYLVHGPQDVAIVANLKNMLSVQVSVEGGAVNAGNFPSQFVNVSNWMMGNLTPILDRWLPIVASSRKASWAIVIDPNSVERPAVEFGTLAGYETPQLFKKLPNTGTMSGAPVPELGDFYTLNQEIKAMSVYGAVQIDGRSAVGSNGSGS